MGLLYTAHKRSGIGREVLSLKEASTRGSERRRMKPTGGQNTERGMLAELAGRGRNKEGEGARKDPAHQERYTKRERKKLTDSLE